jgi:hypothetical protein
MSRFLEHAARILETAEQIGDQSAGEVTVLISPSGAVRIVQETDVPLTSLREMHGASMAYRVTRGLDGGLQITAIEGGRTLQLAPESANTAAKLLLGGGFPRYILK